MAWPGSSHYRGPDYVSHSEQDVECSPSQGGPSVFPFGVSFGYIIFEDGTDLYWARSRVLEYLSTLGPVLPKGVNPTLGPDATGVGWAFMYVLDSEEHDLAELRSLQDWHLRNALTAIPGVAEVASVGGFVKQYQVSVEPNRLRAYDISVGMLRDTIKRSNGEVGRRSVEIAEKEFMVRVKGYLRSLDDLRNVAVMAGEKGIPVRLGDIADVEFGPDMRRGNYRSERQGGGGRRDRRCARQSRRASSHQSGKS